MSDARRDGDGEGREHIVVAEFGEEECGRHGSCNFVDAASATVERLNTATISVTERSLFLDLNGAGFSTPIEECRFA